tara:strand:+ start:5184 stop:6209 length:1026 start_codon:yes stop_codon:yes gene_type:complete
MKFFIRKSYIYIFFISLFSSIFLLLIERSLGLDWDYHVDAQTYAKDSILISEAMLEDRGFISLIGASYYHLVAIFFKQNIQLITIFNMIIYSLTNVLIYDFFRYRIKSFLTDKLGLVLLFIFLFNPYRLHLSTTILKETLITFLTTSLFYPTIITPIIILFLISLRTAGIIYLLAFLDKKKIIICAFLFITTILIFSQIQVLVMDRIEFANATNIIARESDSIPNWTELGFFGSFLRALIWPFIALTGLFIIISPSGFLLPIAIGSIINLFIMIRYKRSLIPFTLSLYLSLSMIAVNAPGYFAFTRYSYPLLSLAPLFICKDINKITSDKNIRSFGFNNLY